MGGVEAGEGFGAEAELGFAEVVERRLHGVEEVVQVARIGLDKEEAGHDLPGREPLLEVGQCRDPVARVVIDGELTQPQITSRLARLAPASAGICPRRRGSVADR